MRKFQVSMPSEEGDEMIVYTFEDENIVGAVAQFLSQQEIEIEEVK